MRKETILIGITGLFVGMVIAGLAGGYSVNHNNTNMMNLMGINNSNTNNTMHDTASDSSMSMNSMVSSLSGKTGDDFDKAFVAGMIVHHQGAINMAKSAQKNAKHQEVKTLADNIITAQTNEISQMRLWQTQWGYVTTSTSSHNYTHDMMNMDH